MNTNHTHQIRTATIVIVVATIAGVGTSASAFGVPTRDGGEARSGNAAFSPYAEPIAALGGRTLAEYVQDHQADDPRTATVI